MNIASLLNGAIVRVILVILVIVIVKVIVIRVSMTLLCTLLAQRRNKKNIKPLQLLWCRKFSASSSATNSWKFVCWWKELVIVTIHDKLGSKREKSNTEHRCHIQSNNLPYINHAQDINTPHRTYCTSETRMHCTHHYHALYCTPTLWRDGTVSISKLFTSRMYSHSQ